MKTAEEWEEEWERGHGYARDLDEFIRAIQADAVESTAVTTVRMDPAWRPIETSPMDGSRILVWSKGDRGVYRATVGHYEHDGWWCDEDFVLEPSHWQPLPEAPRLTDWTEGPDGRSNSSDQYNKIVAVVERLIRNGAHTLINNGPEALARTIVSQLAHVHGLRPDGPR